MSVRGGEENRKSEQGGREGFDESVSEAFLHLLEAITPFPMTYDTNHSPSCVYVAISQAEIWDTCATIKPTYRAYFLFFSSLLLLTTALFF